MVTTVVNNTAEFLDAFNLAGSSGATAENPDVIAMNPANNNGGFYAPSCAPRSRSNLKITSNSDSTPARIAGFQFGRGEVQANFTGVTLSPNGATWTNIVIDNVDFRGPRLNRFRNFQGDTNDLDGPDGSGYCWRIQPPPGSPAGAWKDSATQGGLYLNSSGINGLIVQNCEFNGFGKALKGNAFRNVAIKFNDFRENVEDCMFINSCDGLDIDYNHIFAFRTLTDAEANLHFGVPEMLHGDTIQTPATCDNVRVRWNHLEDKTGHLAFSQMKQSDAPFAGGPPPVSQYHDNHLILSNMLEMAKTTGLNHQYCTNLIVRGNVVARSQINPNDSTNNQPSMNIGWWSGPFPGTGRAPGAIVEHNRAFRMVPHDDAGEAANGWTWNNNTESNPTLDSAGRVTGGYPAQYYTESRARLLTDSSNRATRFGASGTVPVVKPPALTNTQVFYYGLGEDPLIAGETEYRAFQIRIPNTSPAYNKQPRWQLVADASEVVGRQMFLVTTLANGDKIWQATSSTLVDQVGDLNLVPHLRTPGATPPANQFVEVRICYEDVGGGNRSAQSNFNFTVTVTQAGPTYTPTRIVDLSIVSGAGRVLGFYQTDVSGGILPELIVEVHTSDGLLWTKPKPEPIGYETTADLATIGQPNSPAAYGNGAYLMAVAYGTAALTKPAPAFWGAQKLNTGVVQGQAACVVGGFATQANMTLGTFTGANGKTISMSFDGVDVTNPIVDIKASNDASSGFCVVPALVLPTDEDNYALFMLVLTLVSTGSTKPSDEWESVKILGGAPHGTLYRRKTCVKAAPMLNVTLGAASASLGIAFALRLTGSSPA